MTQSVQKVDVELSPVEGWQTSDDVIRDLHFTLSRHRRDTISDETARVEVASFKVLALIFKTALEHSRLTKRLKDGSPLLPSFQIGGPTKT